MQNIIYKILNITRESKIVEQGIIAETDFYHIDYYFKFIVLYQYIKLL